MLQQTVDKINGYGSLLRLVTPVLVTICIFLLGWMLTDIRGLNNHFTNHLMHHQDLEVGYEKRLTTIENTRFTYKDGEQLVEVIKKQLPPKWLTDKVMNMENKIEVILQKIEKTRKK